jgi:glycosyltransferase involved in cell wall biosynthesis
MSGGSRPSTGAAMAGEREGSRGPHGADESVTKPRVTVVLPVHNAQRYLDQALSSCREQTVRDLEILVIDDGSTDESLVIAQQHAAEDPRVRLVVQEQRGVSAARNRGMQLARSTWIALEDADDVSLPLRLERQLAFLERNPEVVALGTHGWHIGANGRRLSVHDIGPRDAAHLERIRRRGQCVWLQTSSVVMRRDLALQLGGFQSGYGVAEDVEMWTRLADEHVVLALPERLHEYRVHPASLSMTRFFDQLQQTSRVELNAGRRRTGLPELDSAAFRRWQRARTLAARVHEALTWRSRYCYRMAGARLINRRPDGFAWLVASWVIAPSVPLGRLRRQLWPRVTEWLARRRGGRSEPGRPRRSSEQPASPR